MRRTPPRRADEHLLWLRAISDTKATQYRPEGPLTIPLAALTGCDHRALEAVDRLWALYCYCDHPDRVLVAIAYAAAEMQESTRPLARELIAHQKDWGDRDRLWPKVERIISEIAGRQPTKPAVVWMTAPEDGLTAHAFSYEEQISDQSSMAALCELRYLNDELRSRTSDDNLCVHCTQLNRKGSTT